MLVEVPKRFDGFCVVAAPGPSLAGLAEKCRGLPVLAVQDAYRLVPWASVMYGCDDRWWLHHNGCPDFAGERWSSHTSKECNDKTECFRRFGLQIVAGAHGKGFSTDRRTIHYGSNSGFQAMNLAILMGAKTIALVGFDWQKVDGRTHYFGEHPQGFGSPNFKSFEPEMEYAARNLPAGVEIYNCTPGSALRFFPMRSPDDLPALALRRHRDGVSGDVEAGQGTLAHCA